MASLFGKNFQILLGGEDITHLVVKADLNTDEYDIGVKLELRGVHGGPPTPPTTAELLKAPVDPTDIALFESADPAYFKGPQPSYVIWDEAAHITEGQYMKLKQKMLATANKKPKYPPLPVHATDHDILDKIAREMVDKKKGNPHE